MKTWELWIDKQGNSAQFGVKFQSLRGGRVLSTAYKLVLAKPLPNITMQVLSTTYGPRKLVILYKWLSQSHRFIYCLVFWEWQGIRCAKRIIWKRERRQERQASAAKRWRKQGEDPSQPCKLCQNPSAICRLLTDSCHWTILNVNAKTEEITFFSNFRLGKKYLLLIVAMFFQSFCKGERRVEDQRQWPRKKQTLLWELVAEEKNWA